MNNTNYKLADAVKRNQEHPTTFHIPSEQEKNEIKIGNHVKLCFMNSEFSERMWVQVTEIRDNNKLIGKLNNDPVLITSLIYDQTIEFEKKNILDILS